MPNQFRNLINAKSRKQKFAGDNQFWLWRVLLGTEQGVRPTRDRGTPQGGVVSPTLMNLFMHYAFDCWMQRSFTQCPFARYADFAVVHRRSEG